MHIHPPPHTHTYTHTCIPPPITHTTQNTPHTHIHTSMQVHAYTHTHTRMHARARTNTRTHAHTHAHTHTHTNHKHTYTHTAQTTHSGNSPGGMTMLQTSEISLYFMMRSLEVVAVREGDAFTCSSINAHVYKTSTLNSNHPHPMPHTGLKKHVHVT